MSAVLLGVCGIALFGFWMGYEAGRAKERRTSRHDSERAWRYQNACREVMQWCVDGELKMARNTAAHIEAHGEGDALNAGTPCGDEPCTISGFRQRLRGLAQDPKGKQ